MLRDRNRPGVKAKPASKPARGPTQRQLRVAEELRHRLAELFTRTEFRDPELTGVHFTVSEVRMTPDLQHATVYVARLGSSEIDALIPALRHAAPFLRSEAGHGLRLRNVPELHFEPDHALDYASRINDLLHSPDVARDLEE